MGELLSALAGHIIFALIGTTLKGILRPISLAALVGGLLVVGATKIGNAIDNTTTNATASSSANASNLVSDAPASDAPVSDAPTANVVEGGSAATPSLTSPSIAQAPESTQPSDQSASPAPQLTATTGWQQVSASLNPALSKLFAEPQAPVPDATATQITPTPDQTQASTPDPAQIQPSADSNPPSEPVSGLW